MKEDKSKVLTKSPEGSHTHQEGRAIVGAHFGQHTRFVPTHIAREREISLNEEGPHEDRLCGAYTKTP